MPRALIIAYNGEQLATPLRTTFPEVTFDVAATPEVAAPYYAQASILLAIDIPSDLLDRMPRIAWLQSLIAGVDRFEEVLAGRPDVLLTSTRGIHGIQMSEMVLTHMLMLTRQAPRMVRNQDRRAWEQFDQPMLHGKTVAVVGIGTAGEATARLCKALGMNVIGVTRTPRRVPTIDRWLDRSRITEAAALSDYLVLTVPHAPETHHLVDEAVLAAMRPGAYLVNVARGDVVDEAALLEALQRGAIAGAGVDVVSGGALGPDSPLWDAPNLIVTPHLAGRSDRYAEQALTVVEPNMRHFLAGEREQMLNVIERRVTSGRSRA